MKRIVLIIASLVTLSACQKYRQTALSNRTTVFLISDKSDSLLSSPVPQEVLALFDLQEDNSKGVFFRSTIISDIQHNESTEIHIEPQRLLLSNPGQRKREIESFLSKARKQVEFINQLKEGREHSQVYQTIVLEANALASKKHKADKKILLIYTDLMDNGELNLYSGQAKDWLYNEPEKLVDLLEKRTQFEDLSGITICIVYKAKDYEHSVTFQKISTIYKQILEKHGARVIIEANLNPDV